LDEADKALGNSVRLEPGSEWVWRYSAELYKRSKNAAKRIEALERPSTLGKPSHTTVVVLRDLRLKEAGVDNWAG
jgi:hypothetical protein